MNSSRQKQAATNPLLAAKRVVIKIGSALLVDGQRNEIRHPWLTGLVEDVVACRARGQEVVLVSSGAVALGRRVLKLEPGALRLEESQAAAACGQIRLAHAYQEALAHHKFGVAQVLLTPNDTEERQSYLNVRATLRNLLEMGVIPVINENDTVATAELRYGDNDRLAARVAAMMDADCLVLLSDIDGLYSADPSVDKKARFISEVHGITPEINAMAGDSRSGFGTGGMKTKLEAARIALNAGCAMIITRGEVIRPLQALENGARFTLFTPECSPAAARKIWIAGSLNPRGSLTIDAGAARALKNGKSLLAAGVRDVSGSFERGDPVRVLADGNEVARGLIAYDASEARKIMGRKSDEFESLLGYGGREEMIHRDDLALL
jgi:glutamate 5-kinase